MQAVGVGVATITTQLNGGVTTATAALVVLAETLVEAASRKRVTKDNGLNERSSRSHLVMSYQVVAAAASADAQAAGAPTLGQLTLVDLAGSERLSRTEATGSLATETAAINKSLSALGDVMTSICGKEGHVPYRNSKLTHLLQPSLSRGSKVMFIVTASPDEVDAPETLISLGFGTRARNAQLGAERAAASTARPAPLSTHASTASLGGGGLTPGRPAGGRSGC